VEAFLAGAIPFTGIAEAVSRALEAHVSQPADSLESIEAADRETRETAHTLCNR